jgi:hypothetical protein
MSNCSCGGSCNCGTGPCIKISDLEKGEQVVTIVKREDIPKDKPKEKPSGPNVTQIIVSIYISIALAITIKTILELQAQVDIGPPGSNGPEWTPPRQPPDIYPNPPKPQPRYPETPSEPYCPDFQDPPCLK